MWCLEVRSVLFLFQAEDGIRDDLVTGVQTCALPIYHHSGRPDDLLQRWQRDAHLEQRKRESVVPQWQSDRRRDEPAVHRHHERQLHRDRKSTRLNSSLQIISYAVFCLKKKKMTQI